MDSTVTGKEQIITTPKKARKTTKLQEDTKIKTVPLSSLKGILKKPNQHVSLEEMDKAIHFKHRQKL